jgi:bifunctional ADP-heptose synthase (sugar kinase/adenylyltransferase)
LVKGGDWSKNAIVGSDFVESYGGEVKTVPYLEGFSTTAIIEKSKHP